MRLESTKNKLKTELDGHLGSTGLFFSAGADSLLLLHMLIDLQAAFSIVALENTFTKEQKAEIDKWVIEYELRVFNYAPANAYLIGDGEEISLVEEYAMLDGHLMPFIRDAVHDGSRCAVEDVIVDRFLPVAPVGFTLNLFGTRKDDEHFSTGNIWQNPRTTVHDKFVYFAPLWDWSKAEVLEALDHYGVEPPTIDTGDIPMCLNCLKGSGKVPCPKTGGEVDAIDWQPREMLKEFQAKHAI